MCVVSMVIGQFLNTHPPDSTKWLIPYQSQRFFELLDAAKKKDIEEGNEDCSSPEKQDYLKQIMERLDSIEKKIDGPQ